MATETEAIYKIDWSEGIFASAVFFMALVFCLNLKCSPGCSGSKDCP